MAPIVEKIPIEIAVVSEGPHWDADTQSLYYVDVFGQTINRYVPSTGKHTKASLGKHASIIIPVKGKKDQFVITTGHEVLLISWDGESDKISVVEKLYEVDEDKPTTFNDGKADPSGRLWAGTLGTRTDEEEFSDEKGTLFSFKNKKVTTHLTKIGLANGLAFNADLKKLYYIDTLKGTLDEFDFDIIKGEISNGKPIYTLHKTRGFPKPRGLDGMTIDVDGNLWVAVGNDARVIKIDPRKPETIQQTINFPVKQTTSVAFGGPNLDELYVTSGRVTIFGETPSSPDAGALFKVTGLNTKGLPGDKVVL